MMRKSWRDGQRGAALLIVLLMAATLSFIAISITERTRLTAERSVHQRTRSEATWIAFGAEELAKLAVERAVAASNGRLSIDDPWVTEPRIIPFDNGEARLGFTDITTCFNVNSLGRGAQSPDANNNDGAGGPVAGQPASEFALLARNLGLSEFDGERIADVIGDWVDEDTARRGQGAEDEYYTTLPSPYRVGNGEIASITELRAMRGFTRDIYGLFRPHLCAHPDDTPSRSMLICSLRRMRLF